MPGDLAALLRLQASTIRDGVGAATGDLRLHAFALLIKLEHHELAGSAG